MSTAAARPIHARVLGAGAPGPPVVLVHGLGVSSRYMLPLARRICPHHPVHCPDLPGFGRTPGPRALGPARMAGVLAGWMHAAGLEGAVVVGHSLGCQTVAHLAARHPALVRHAVLLSPTFDASARGMVPQALRWLGSMPWERPAILPVLAREYVDSGSRRILATLRRGLDDHIEEVLPRVPRPVLVVRGARDPLVPARWAAELARRAPLGALATVPGRSHAINFSAPGAVATLVLAASDGARAPR